MPTPGNSFVKIEVDGVQKLNRKLDKLSGKALEKGLRDEYKAVAVAVAKSARTGTEVPVLTGRLAASIRPVTGTDNTAGVAAGTESRVQYAGPIHFGWRARNIPARPFLYEAVANKEPNTAKVLTKGIQAMINKHGLGREGNI